MDYKIVGVRLFVYRGGKPPLYFVVSLLNSLTHSYLLLYIHIRIIYLIPSINGPTKSLFLVSLIWLLLQVKDKQ